MKIMDLTKAIAERRSIKKYTDRPVARASIERMLEAGTQAPNHRMTQPWEFLVLGPESRRAYGAVLGGRKARRVEDPDAAAAVRLKCIRQHEELPAAIVVTCRLDENPEIQEEDIAATWMAIQNLSLAALAEGLGTHIKTGGVMNDAAVRDALGVGEERRVIAFIEVGEPAEQPSEKARTPAAEKTRWLP
jgi:nitroreductase